MKNKRNYFSDKTETKQQYKTMMKKDNEGYVHVPVCSTLFYDMSTMLIATNSSYQELKNDIKPCLEGISSKEKICVDVFETKESEEFSRESTIIGFKRYMNSVCYGQSKSFWKKFALFFSIMLLGIAIEFILYGLIGQDNEVFPFWVFKSIEVLGTLFIWQFGGFLAFELPGDLKSYRRNKQICNCKFKFRKFN